MCFDIFYVAGYKVIRPPAEGRRIVCFSGVLPVNKSELIERLAERSGLNVMQSEEIVNLIYRKMRDTLVSGGRIEIRGFGSFVVKEYQAYQGRNPKTGEKISVPPKKLPFFKVGKELKERIDNIPDEPQAAGTEVR
jgi:integration host factor subunit beta